jgi:hypothetical protein
MKKLIAIFFALYFSTALAQTFKTQNLSVAGTGTITSLATTGWTEATALGFVGDGVTNNATALATLAANASAPHVYWTPGTYQVNGCPGDVFQAPIVWKGAPGSIIKFTCTLPAFPTAPIQSNGLSGYIDGMTFDLSNVTNTVGIAPTTFNPFLYFNNVTSGVWVQNSKIINAPVQTALIFLNGVQNVWITNNFLSLAVASPLENLCIAMTTSAGNGENVLVQGNHCVNTGMFLDGNAIRTIGNEVDHWGSGSGITMGGAPDTPGDGNQMVVGNYIHDGQPWVDANNVEPAGIEFWLPHTLIANNVVQNTSGSAISGASLYATITGNDVSGWGMCSVSACAGISEYGIFLGYMNGQYNGSYSIVTGNRGTNPSSVLPTYGYGDQAGGLVGINLTGNSLTSQNGNMPYSQMNGTGYTGTDVWNAWSPGATTTGGSGVSVVVNSARYNLVGHSMKFTLQMTLTFTTAPTSLNFTVPFTPNAGSVASGQETGAGHLVTGLITGGSTSVTLTASSGFATSGEIVIVSGQYDIQ